jgi:SAM-dependent methyltransferase
MLTVDYDRLDVRPGHRLLDAGCGAGRHSVEAVRRGADVVAVDLGATDLASAQRGVADYGHADVPTPGGFSAVRADARRLPFAGASFDRVIAAEVLEHIDDDGAALAELARVLRPGGLIAVTVPRWLPERVCWALSRDYHEVPGGHIRIYRGDGLHDALRGAGLQPTAQHHAHALHTPYWWLRCVYGPQRDDPLPVRLYHRMLVWDMFEKPALTRRLERALDPVLGKSLVVYARKPAAAPRDHEVRDDAA